MYAAAVRHRVPLLTTTSAAQAAVSGIKALRGWELKVRDIQRHHGNRAPAPAADRPDRPS